MIIWVEGWGSGKVTKSESGSKERRLRSLQNQLDLLGNSYRELQQCPFYRSLISTPKPRRSNTSKASFGRTALSARIAVSSAVVSMIWRAFAASRARRTRKALSATRSDEHTSELQSLMRISYAVFWFKSKI